MTQTFHKLKATKDKSLRIKGEKIEFEKDQIISAESSIARHLVNVSRSAKYTGEKYEVEDADSAVIIGDTVNTKNEDEEEDEDSDEKEFDFEEYVGEHNADTVIEDVESTDSVAWLENLRNYDERKTVHDAIDERIDELE